MKKSGKKKPNKLIELFKKKPKHLPAEKETECLAECAEPPSEDLDTCVRQELESQGHSIRVMEIIHDEKYGKILKAYVDDTKRYIVGGKIITDQAIIDDLDNRHGRPVHERGIC